MRKEKNYGIHFGSKYELEPAKVKRFIWHVTRKEKRESIIQYGLLTAQKHYNSSRPISNLLFANNLDHDLMNMWPVRFSYDQGYGIEGSNYETNLMIVNYEMGIGFDFWRIDTHKANAQWFVDPILAQEWWCWGLESKYHYVCTPNCIAPAALTLFEFEPEYREKSFIKWGDGVAHISFNQLPLKKAA